MDDRDIQKLRSLTSFEDLVIYLRDELDWPIDFEDAEDLDRVTFDYSTEDLGIDPKHAVKIETIKQIRPLADGQRWGVFYIEFEPKRLPVVVLRRILHALNPSGRNSDPNRPAWKTGDLLFISAFGDESAGEREIAFAHFHQEVGALPTLRVLGWDGADTPLKLDYVARTLKKYLSWPDDHTDIVTWQKQWAGAFHHRIGHVIRTANALAERLAILARGIRDAASTIMEHESEQGSLRRLHKAFQTALIHDMSEADFADTYAQTITYGLLTAAISRTDMSAGQYGTSLVAENITDMVPITNPFLREMLQTFLQVGGNKGGINFDELGVQEVVELLRGEETDMPAILRDFNNQAPGEDPVIHFYEKFLTFYNKKLKIKRGVFYTPKPVVSYIVRSVHELLQTEFGLVDGLADITTWGEMELLIPNLKRPETASPDSPFVMILDPAVGTATFLVEVIDVIHKTLISKWQKQVLTDQEQKNAWNEYVPKHLLPRLFGYELMMAPYSIAHMKIGLKLYETGYRFENDERVRVYLTNALEPAQDFSGKFAFAIPALAHEAEAVNKIKRYQRFTVIIGNPPYAGHSSNTGEWISNLVHDYYYVDGSTLDERNPKWLQDDYVKFIRLGEHYITQAGCGIQSYITNHGYINNPTFRGFRQHLTKSFNAIDILDLHGNSTKKELCPDGSKDQNVFDIKQGVAIFAARRTSSNRGIKGFILHRHLFGLRDAKYEELQKSTLMTGKADCVHPATPFYLFVPQDLSLRAEYETFIEPKNALPVNVLGFQTHRDAVAIAFNKKTLLAQVTKFLGRKLSNKEITTFVSPSTYRLFDERYVYLNTDVCDRPRRELIDHVVDRDNLCLGLGRQGIAVQDPIWSLVTISRYPFDANIFRRGGINVFPLWLYPQKGELSFEKLRKPNFSIGFVAKLVKSLSLRQEVDGSFPTDISPEGVVYYFYATLHSNTYRTRYAEFLKIDFPRIPLISNLNLFRALEEHGQNLVAFHLMESPKLNDHITTLLGSVDFQVEKISYSEETVWIDRSETRGFKGVPEEVWNFHIGGYQVCHKWLKDRQSKGGKTPRPGRVLTEEDINHYQKIVVAISETIRIMGEIDEVIEEHGGWPIQ
jgi:hypothetical protein